MGSSMLYPSTDSGTSMSIESVEESISSMQLTKPAPSHARSRTRGGSPRWLARSRPEGKRLTSPMKAMRVAVERRMPGLLGR